MLVANEIFVTELANFETLCALVNEIGIGLAVSTLHLQGSR